jgi:hypothetical protein
MRRRVASAAGAGERYARRRWPLLAFVAVLTAYRLTQWGYFIVPAPDFFDFEHTARALAAGHLPNQFQRAPLYPALIALVSPLVGGARPTLAAAQGINLALSAAALVVMYELCFLIVGRWALLVVMLSGLHWTMAYVTVHPLVEPTLMAAMLTALYLHASGRRGAYLAAGLAAAGRYDALAVVAALAGCDWWRRRDPRRVALAAGLAAAPAFTWLAIGALRGAPNPYAQVVVAQSPAGWEFVRSLAISTIGFMPVQVLQGVLADRAVWRAVATGAFAVMAVLMAIGARVLVRRRPDVAAPMLSLGALYVGIHLAYPAANTRFALPVLWLLHLLAVAGGLAVARSTQAHWRVGPGWRWAGAAASGGGAAAAAWAARPDWPWIVPLATPVAMGVTGARAAGRQVVAALAVTALAAAGAMGLSGWYLERESAWWAELQPVARWCDQPRAEPACLAGTSSALALVRELCTRPRVRFCDLGPLERARPGIALPAQVTHVLWSSTDIPLGGRQPAMVLSHRYADERRRLIPTGQQLVRRVACGRVVGWRACAEFTVRGQRAIIYRRETTVQARVGMEVRR